MPGNWISSSTIRGRSRSTTASADSPSSASPTTSNPAASSNALAEDRKPGWSSTITTVGFTHRSSHAMTMPTSGLPLGSGPWSEGNAPARVATLYHGRCSVDGDQAAEGQGALIDPDRADSPDRSGAGYQGHAIDAYRAPPGERMPRRCVDPPFPGPVRVWTQPDADAIGQYRANGVQPGRR